MILLDTDILTLYFRDHSRVKYRLESAPEVPVTSIVTRVEILQGRFASLLKSADADDLMRAQNRLKLAENALVKFRIVSFDRTAAEKFNVLRQGKKLRKIGRNDLLIACIALAQDATLVTRNVKDFLAVPGVNVQNWAD
jgi:tRNA(fMet)-specific endonuclease VapC